MIRLLLIVTFISTVYTKVVAQESLKSPKDLILLIGQSNMAGRATLLPEDDKVIDGAFLYDSLNHWIPLKNPLNIHSSIRKIARMQKLNLGFTFAKKITETKTLNPIGLVVNARGGTKIQAWVPGTFYYKEAVRRSLEAMKEGGTKGELKQKWRPFLYPFVRLSWQSFLHRKATALQGSETYHSTHYCLPWDLDIWLELNNGCTLSIYDMGRLPIVTTENL